MIKLKKDWRELLDIFLKENTVFISDSILFEIEDEELIIIRDDTEGKEEDDVLDIMITPLSNYLIESRKMINSTLSQWIPNHLIEEIYVKLKEDWRELLQDIIDNAKDEDDFYIRYKELEKMTGLELKIIQRDIGAILDLFVSAKEDDSLCQWIPSSIVDEV